jgi:prepilin-type N-terminal cleavage/methylation domain-containing protein
VIRNKRGLSLIELVIALALLSTVLAVGYSFYFFGTNAFASGESRSNMQRDLRQVSDMVTRNIRNASNINVVNSVTNDTYQYIYLSNKAIMHRQSDGNVRTLTDPHVETLSFTLVRLSNGENYLHFTMESTATVNNQDYDITSNVALNNIRGHLGATGKVLRFSTN